MSARIVLAVVLAVVLAHVRCPVALPPPPVLALAAVAALCGVGVWLVRLVLADRAAGWRPGGAR